MNFTCMVLLISAAAGSLVFAQQPSNSITPAPPIPISPKALLEKDFAIEERQWAERCLLAPAKKTWQGQPWSDEAAKLVQETLTLQQVENAPIANLSALASRYRSLLEKAGADPLINLLAARTFFDEHQNWRDAQPALDRLLTNSALPAVIESQALQIIFPKLHTRGENRMTEYHRLLNAIKRSVNDGSYDPASEAVFVRHQMDAIEISGVQYTPWFQDYKTLIHSSQWSDWAKLTLEGYAEVEMAWVGRTSKWASEVQDEQWQQFAAHLKIARELLTEAYERRPERPEAAAKMITVAMANSIESDELRLWFDRAITAQFDYMEAYSSVLWAYHPRWGGSYQRMLAFGQACADTKRFDTAIPLRFMCACIDIGQDQGVPDSLRKQLITHPTLLAISQGYLDAKDVPPQTRHMRTSNAALCAWLAKDSALAQRALKEAGGSLHPVAVQYLHQMLLHEGMMRQEISAAAGAFGDAIKAIATPPESKNREELLKEITQIPEANLPTEAKHYLAEARDLLSFSDAFVSGKWLPIKPRPGLTNDYQTGGRWSADADGTLIASGDDALWREFLFRIPLRADLEMRGQIAFDIPEAAANTNGIGFGPVLQWTPSAAGVRVGGSRFMLLTQGTGQGQGTARMVSRKFDNASPEESVTLEAKNTFRARIADSKLTFEINGHTIATDVPQDSIGMENQGGGFFGFTAYRLPSGAKIRVTNLEVRKLDAETITKEAKATPAPETAPSAAPTPAPPESPAKEPVKAPKPVSKKTSVANPPIAVTPPASSNKLYWQLGALGAVLLIAVFVQKFVTSRES